MNREQAAKILNAAAIMWDDDPMIFNTLERLCRGRNTLEVYRFFVKNPEQSLSVRIIQERLRITEPTAHRAKNILVDLKLITECGLVRDVRGSRDVGGPSTTLYTLNKGLV